jgi:hypothetical protein
MLIEPRIESRLDVRVLSVSTQRDQGRTAQIRIVANPPRELETAHDRQPEIHDRQIRVETFEDLLRRKPDGYTPG